MTVRPSEPVQADGPPPVEVTVVAAPADGSIWRNGDFMRLWVAQALSHTALNAVWFALWILVEERTRSSTQISIAIITSIMPSVLLGPLAGVLIDRLNKRAVLIGTMVARVPTILLFMLHEVSLPLLYATNFVFNAIGLFFGPSEGAKIPQIVRREQIITANSLFNITFTIAQFLGLVVIGPALVKLAYPELVFILAAVTFVICGGLLWLLPAAEPPTRPLHELRGRRVLAALWREVVDGWRFVTQDRLTSLALAHLTLAAVLTLVMPALAPRFAVAVLGIGAADSIWVLAPAGVGLFVGTSLVPALAKRHGKGTVVGFGLVVMATFLVVLAGVRAGFDLVAAFTAGWESAPVLSVVPVVMLATFAVGLTMALVSVPAQTVLMERAPDEKRGRVLSTQYMVSNLISTGFLLGLGALGDLLGITQVMLLIAVGVAALWFVSLRVEGRAA